MERKIYLRPSRLTSFSDRPCDMPVLSVTTNGLVLKKTITGAVCGTMADAIGQDGFIYFNPNRNYPTPYAHIYDTIDSSVHRIDRPAAFVVPHPSGEVSVIGQGLEGTSVQRLSRTTLQPIAEVNFPVSFYDRNYGFTIVSVAAMGEDKLGASSGHAIYFLDLILRPTDSVQVWSVDESHIVLRFSTDSGKRYRIEKAANIIAPDWTQVHEIAGTGEDSDVTVATQDNMGFFRLLVLPAE